MFTGLISNLGQILHVIRSSTDVWQIKVKSSLFVQSKIGDSIAVDGCCLTIVILEEDVATFTLMLETLTRTTFSQKSASDKVHIEKSASLQSAVEGHCISGHISGVVLLTQRDRSRDGSLTLTFQLSNAPSFLTYKGSVAIDGVSLTVSNLTQDSFSVSLIPHTQAVTLLTKGDVGAGYNIEVKGDIPLPIYPDLMGLALQKSLLGRITAPSNPWVGCVITNKMGNIVATGFHRKRGEKHAEVDALSKLLAEEPKADYTLYCTLEPCNHTGLQPPCTKAILVSGIRKVVVGILDPDTRVAGTGVTFLREAGIEVIVLNDTRISKSLAPYITHRQTKKPYVTLKMAMSLDGKIGLPSCPQYPISGPESREHCHLLRLKSQAILVGTVTALVDQPQLTVRLSTSSTYYSASQEHKPLRCFLDLQGKVLLGPLLDTTIAPTLVFTNSETCNKETLTLWKNKGLQIAFVSVDQGKINLSEVLEELGKRGVLSLLVEGGSQIFTSFVENKLANRIILYIAPILLGNSGISLFKSEKPLINLYKQEKVKAKGGDTVITYTRISI